MRINRVINKHKLNYVGLSFVRNEHDILQAKDFINHGIKIISKVETKAAVVNLIAILKKLILFWLTGAIFQLRLELKKYQHIKRIF